MVIEFSNAPVANIAMAAIHSVGRLTIRAKGIGIKFFDELLELEVWHAPDIAGIEESCFDITNIYY